MDKTKLTLSKKFKHLGKSYEEFAREINLPKEVVATILGPRSEKVELEVNKQLNNLFLVN